MNQELNKEGLAAAEKAYDDAADSVDGTYCDIVRLEMAIQGYLNHTKVTGFEGRIAELFDENDNTPPHRWIVDAGVLIKDMQSALAAKGR